MFKKIMIILVITLSGCATFDVPIPHDLSKDKLTDENIMILFSTRANDYSISSASVLAIYKANGGGTLLSYHIDNYALKPHFQEGWGFLNIGFLPPGEYRYELHSLNPYASYGKFKNPIRFTVKGNKVIYLGEAYLGANTLQIRNQWARIFQCFWSEILNLLKKI